MAKHGKHNIKSRIFVLPKYISVIFNIPVVVSFTDQSEKLISSPAKHRP